MQQENKKITKNIFTKSKGFTLVELIIVITILAILGTIAYISFQGYTKDARDGVRISDIRQIYNGLSIYKTQTEKTLLPDNYINIQSGTTTISYQGYAGASVLKNLKISGGKDPGTKDYYIYTTDVNTKKAQLMTYMETTDKDIQYLSQLKTLKLISQAEATNSGYYQDKKIYVYGDKIGILTDSNKVPLQETTSSTGINIITTTTPITTYFGGNVYDGGLSTNTGLTLINQINGAISNTLPCSPTTYNSYTISSLSDKQTQTFTKTGTITGGTQTGSILATCNNGTLSYGTESFQTSCNANFTLSGNVCNVVPVLLLHSDNITTSTGFIDSSPSNKAITRNGDTTQVGGRGYFDGSTSYISTPNNSDFNFGTGDFTIDTWVFPTTTNNGIIVAFGPDWNATTQNYWVLAIQNGKWRFVVYGGGINVDINDGNNVVANQLYHISAVRNGNTFKLYVNGQQWGSTNTYAGTVGNSISDPLRIGWLSRSPQPYFQGYIDELRISKGIARWTSNFTPSIGEYSTDIYTKLLLHFNGSGTTYTDDSGTSKSITANGNVTQYPSKFGSGTIFFDGAGDYLSFNNSSDFNFGTGDFTIDFWMNPISNTSNSMIIDYSNGGSTDKEMLLQFYNGQLLFYYTTDGSTNKVLGGNVTINNGIWYHIAIIRTGNTMLMFINGTQVHSLNVNSDILWNSSQPLRIGWNQYGGGYFNGYIDEFRVAKGAAVWTSNFTPPTSPY